MTLWSRGLVRWRDKLKSLYLHYHSAYGHHISQDGDLYWWTPAHKVTWPPGHVVLWDHMTTENHYISTTTVSMATQNLASLWLVMMGFHPLCYTTIWSRGLVRSFDKIKSLYCATKLGRMLTTFTAFYL